MEHAHAVRSLQQSVTLAKAQDQQWREQLCKWLSLPASLSTEARIQRQAGQSISESWTCSQPAWRFSPGNEWGQLQIVDDGPGLPAGLNFSQATSMGLRLINMLVRRLRACLEVGPGHGTNILLSPARGKCGHRKGCCLRRVPIVEDEAIVAD